MFTYFPGNCTRFPAATLSMMADGEPGQIDRQLRMFNGADGGSEHCNADDPNPARQVFADRFGEHL